MKISSKVASWIDKLDAKIFGREGYRPLAGQGFVLALKVGIGVGIVLFLVQMFGTGKTAQNWVVGIGAALILGSMVMVTLPNFKDETAGIGMKIGYGFFCLFLTFVALQLAMWIVMLILAILVFYIILYFVGGNTVKSKSKSRSGKVERDDCYHCETKGMGKRVCLKLSDYEGKEVECNSYNPANCPHYIRR